MEFGVVNGVSSKSSGNSGSVSGNQGINSGFIHTTESFALPSGL